jgi:hypothetical protein
MSAHEAPLFSGSTWLRRGLWALLFLVCLFIALSASLYQAQERLVELGEQRLQSNQLADQLRQSSDDLTRMVRTYAATGDSRFLEQFFHVLDIRNGAQPRPLHYHRVYWDFLSVPEGRAPFPNGVAVSWETLMERSGFTPSERGLLDASRQRSDALVLLEQQAMTLVAEGLKAKEAGELAQWQQARWDALSLLFGEPYHRAKVSIMTPINAFFAEVSSRTEREVRRQAIRVQWIFWVMVLVFMAFLSTLWWMMARAKRFHHHLVYQLNEGIDAKTRALRQMNEELQAEMEERQRAEAEIHALQELIPICAHCKSVRDDQGYWNQLESYLKEHVSLTFSHGLCPDCMEKHYSDYL